MNKYASKERVMRAIHHEVPDRVPVNYRANPGIDRKLKNYFNIALGDGENELLLEALGIDFRHAGLWYCGPKLHPDHPERGVRVNEWGDHFCYIEHESGGYWDFCEFPLRDADEETVANFPLPSPDDYNYAEMLRQVRTMQHHAVIIGEPGYADVINANGRVRSMEQILIDLALDDPAGMLLIKRRAEIQLEVLRRALELGKGKQSFDIVFIGEDLGTQIGPMISMEIYNRHLRAIHQRFIDLAKSFELPLMVHSCGSSSWVFPTFIDMGVSGVDALQPEARKMSPEFLAENFGEKLFFHGAISTAGNLSFGTPQDVRRECRHAIETLGKNGGYICCPAHDIQDNSPVENVLALYDEAKSLR